MSAPVRVVVVTYSPGTALDVFLDSLEQATGMTPAVVLADNGSTDGSVERAAERPGVRLLRTGGNLGYGAAANRGAEGATEDWLLVANPDVRFLPGALDALLEATGRWPRAAVFGPAIRTPAGDRYPSAREFPTLTRGVGHALFGRVWPGNRWTRAYRRESGPLPEGPSGWLSGSCLLLRRAVFEEVGGFDPRYFMYFEDLDLCARLAAQGWQSVYVPGAQVEHAGGHATRRSPASMLKAHHRSAYRYLAARYPGRRWLPLRLVLAAGLAARYLVTRLTRR